MRQAPLRNVGPRRAALDGAFLRPSDDAGLLERVPHVRDAAHEAAVVAGIGGAVRDEVRDPAAGGAQHRDGVRHARVASVDDHGGARVGTDALVAAIRTAPAGNAHAFDELVRRHQRRILANCRHLARASNDAEDLAQEVFVKAYFSLEGFEGRSTFITWLTRIKTNHCLNYLQRRRGVRYVEFEDAEKTHDARLRQEPLVLSDLERRDERARIDATLDALPDTLRVPLVLRDIDGLSYEAVADTLGIGLSAAKMRIKRAREQFRVLFSTIERGGESLLVEAHGT